MKLKLHCCIQHHPEQNRIFYFHDANNTRAPQSEGSYTVCGNVSSFISPICTSNCHSSETKMWHWSFRWELVEFGLLWACLCRLYLRATLLRYLCRMFYTDSTVDVGYCRWKSIHFPCGTSSPISLLRCGDSGMCSAFQGNDNWSGSSAAGCDAVGNARRRNCRWRAEWWNHCFDNAKGNASLSALPVVQTTACPSLQVRSLSPIFPRQGFLGRIGFVIVSFLWVYCTVSNVTSHIPPYWSIPVYVDVVLLKWITIAHGWTTVLELAITNTFCSLSFIPASPASTVCPW